MAANTRWQQTKTDKKQQTKRQETKSNRQKQKNPNKKNTSYWKIGKISAIGLLANEDAVVFEAESSLYGMYGSYDVRDYASTRYFKFTPRINTPDGVDTNNYSNSPYTINNIILYLHLHF